jgi:hypothetical protein|tara:strand:+ start:152 stop:868 length:717 start_codon:yes stop_codon:yes gene_type:complete
MSTWGFGQESNQVAAGANTVAAIIKGHQPHYQADNMASKRNVIATSAGWVRRTHGTGGRANRAFDEIIVAANPTGSDDYPSSASHMGKPDIAQVYVKLNANGYIAANTVANLYVVFNTPMKFRANTSSAASNNAIINLANTIGGNAAVAIANNSVTIDNANNTIVFKLGNLQGGSGNAKATYAIESNVIMSGMSLYNPDVGITAAANLVITGGVANNLLDGNGNRITTFQVARPAGQT